MGLALLILTIGVTIGVRISGTLSPEEGQSKHGSAFASVFFGFITDRFLEYDARHTVACKRSDIFRDMFYTMIWNTAKIRG
jgi:hypothetical protein